MRLFRIRQATRSKFYFSLAMEFGFSPIIPMLLYRTTDTLASYASNTTEGGCRL
jgi:hypothetical protein